MKTSLIAVAALAVVGFSGAANAGALSMAKDAGLAAQSTSQIELVHGWHRSCQLGARGWHYHSRGDRLGCRPFRRVYRRY